MRLTFDFSPFTGSKMFAGVLAIGLGLVVLSLSYVCILSLIAINSGAETLAEAQQDLINGLKSL